MKTLLAIALTLFVVPPYGPGMPGPRHCVSIVGDSLAGGETMFMVPNLDFVPVGTVTIATHLSALLPGLGLEGWPVYNRSQWGTGISSKNHPSYRATQAYRALLGDRCAYTVIF